VTPQSPVFVTEFSVEEPRMEKVRGLSMDEGGVRATIRKELLNTKYTEEIRQMGDLSRMTVERFVEVLNRKSLGLNGWGSQKVVPAAEVRALIEQGWEYVSQLPDGYTIVRLPRNGLGQA
jgi:hypothetical protein